MKLLGTGGAGYIGGVVTHALATLSTYPALSFHVTLIAPSGSVFNLEVHLHIHQAIQCELFSLKTRVGLVVHMLTLELHERRASRQSKSLRTRMLQSLGPASSS